MTLHVFSTFQVTKERLQLERHLQIANDSLQRNNGVDLQKYLTLEQSNHYLRQQLDSLDLLQQEHKLVEIQYREKEEACRYVFSFSHMFKYLYIMQCVSYLVLCCVCFEPLPNSIAT